MQENLVNRNVTEKAIQPVSGFAVLFGLLGLSALAGLALIAGVIGVVQAASAASYALTALGGFFFALVIPLCLNGFIVVAPREAAVLTLFGKYYGSIKKDGFYFVNPFIARVARPQKGATSARMAVDSSTEVTDKRKRIPLKVLTLNNERQKINDKLGNPVIIGIVVTWRITDTAKALFSVNNYYEFLSIECDSALRNTVRLYPYDTTDEENSSQQTLRSSSEEITEQLKGVIQSKVGEAGIEILDAYITNLSYAPEIAQAMLQRQQAAAVVDARQMIVEGAVGMVEMALNRLAAEGVVELDEERKATMVSNLMVVLCSSKEAQPIVNTGSLY